MNVKREVVHGSIEKPCAVADSSPKSPHRVFNVRRVFVWDIGRLLIIANGFGGSLARSSWKKSLVHYPIRRLGSGDDR